MRVLLIHYGSFSHINDSVQQALRCRGYEVDALDIRARLSSDRTFWARATLRAVAHHGPGAATARARMRWAAMRTPWFMDAARAVVLDHARNRDYAFTLQTQSLFDASTGRAPHGVYTDHVAAARLRAGFDEKAGRYTEAWRAREADIFRAADKVFTFGPRMRRILLDTYGAPSDKVLSVGAGPNARPEPRHAERKPGRRILFVGIDWERKGGPVLLDGFLRLRSRLPDARLVIAGCDPRISAPGVEILGRVPRPRVAKLFSECDLFCMPSRLEPFGIVYVEALHAGLPVIGSEGGDLADVVEEGVNGHLVPPNNPAILCERIRSVLEDPDRALSMGRASAARATRFEWDTVARSMESALLETGPLGAAA